MGTLEIRLFNSFRLDRDGGPVDHFPSKRVRDLLCYLLLNRDQFHPREILAGLFWGDFDDRRARHCLNTALWRLNQILIDPATGKNPYLRVDGQVIGFNTASESWIDVAEFEARCTLAQRSAANAPEQQIEWYRQAVSLYSGELLRDCYEDWCLIEREKLQRLYLRALSELMSHCVEHQDQAGAIDCAHRILACDPLHEEVHRDLIQMHLVANRPAAALRQYRLCEEILRRELGSEPMPETQAFLPRIMSMTGHREDAQVQDHATAFAVRVTALDGTAHDLTAAISTLQDATRIFEEACTRLLTATKLVEEATRQIDDPPRAPAHSQDPVVAELKRARSRITQAASWLEPASPSSFPAS